MANQVAQATILLTSAKWCTAGKRKNPPGVIGRAWRVSAAGGPGRLSAGLWPTGRGNGLPLPRVSRVRRYGARHGCHDLPAVGVRIHCRSPTPRGTPEHRHGGGVDHIPITLLFLTLHHSCPHHRDWPASEILNLALVAGAGDRPCRPVDTGHAASIYSRESTSTVQSAIFGPLVGRIQQRQAPGQTEHSREPHDVRGGRFGSDDGPSDGSNSRPQRRLPRDLTKEAIH